MQPAVSIDGGGAATELADVNQLLLLLQEW